MWPDRGGPRPVADDPELDGIVRLAVHIGGSPAFVSLGAHTNGGSRTWPLRGSDGVVRGNLTVGAGPLDAGRRVGLELLAAQAGALLERRDREGRLQDVIAGRVAQDLSAPLATVHDLLARVDGPLCGETSERAAECISAALDAAIRARATADELLGLVSTEIGTP